MSNNPGGLFKSSNTNNMRNGRLTTLANRMLGIEQPNTTTTSTQPSTDPNQPQANPMSSIKRNLFGCRLDHEQLHADLQQMLAEQRRVKSAQWSFDFDTLRPIESDRVQWRRVRVPVKPSTTTSTLSSPTSPTPQERDDQKYLFISGIESDEEDEHDEEDDEALAVPEFYKRQRRFKLAEVDKNRLNVMANTQKSTSTVSNSENKPVAMTKTTTINPTLVKCIPNPTCAVPATPVKQPVITTSRSSRKKTTAEFDQLGKILTYSENRKDTLRSASASTSHRQASSSTVVAISFKTSINSAFSQSARKQPASNVKLQQRRTTKNTINNHNNNENKMRQQTLHDLNVFKQRKKRQTSESDETAKLKATSSSANAENPHYLRSHSSTTASTK